MRSITIASREEDGCAGTSAFTRVFEALLPRMTVKPIRPFSRLKFANMRVEHWA